MGISRIPKYRVNVRMSGGYTDPWAWEGRPSDIALRAMVKAFEASTEPGGVNAHLGRTVIWSAAIINQFTGERMASYRGPLFAVVD